MKSIQAAEQTKIEKDDSLHDTCPACLSRRKVVTLTGLLEWNDEQECWVPLTVSICNICGQSTIHAFHPETFTSVRVNDRNKEPGNNTQKVVLKF